MLSFDSAVNRSTPLMLPLITLLACVLTLLSYGAPSHEAWSRPLASWLRGALIVEGAIGGIIAVADCFMPAKRRTFTFAVAAMVALAVPFGCSTAMGLLF